MIQNIIIQEAAGANRFIRSSLVNSFHIAGYNVVFWNSCEKSPFDLFYEFPCDLFVGDTWQLNRPLVKNLINRPEIKVILYGDIWGSIDIDLNRYPVGIATDQQKNLVEELIRGKSSIRSIVSNHSPKFVQDTHGKWRSELGIHVESLPVSADITTYYPRSSSISNESDITYVGGYWPYKSRNLNQYILPLCYPNTSWKIRIFGTGWNVVNYLGQIDINDEAFHYTNTKIISHVVESHCSDIYADWPLRYFQVPACGGFGVSCPCVDIRSVFNETELVVAEDPNDFFEKITHYLNHQDETIPFRQKAQEKVLSGHTGFDRCIQLMDLIGEDTQSLQIAKERVIRENYSRKS